MTPVDEGGPDLPLAQGTDVLGGSKARNDPQVRRGQEKNDDAPLSEGKGPIRPAGRGEDDSALTPRL